MSHILTRRRFVLSAAAATLGAAGYGLSRAVQSVREAERRTADL